MRLRLTALICLTVWGTNANAQQIGAIHLQVDNDYFALRLGRQPQDFDYTSGIELELELDNAPFWLSWPVSSQATKPTLSLAIGQEIYTPRSRGVREVPGERPFAGWLYGAASVRSVTSQSIRTLRVEVGVTGPPALADEAQTSLHEIFGSYRIDGWEDQLPFEPAFAVRYRIARRLHMAKSDNLRLEARPHAAVGAGTIWSGASTGAKIIADLGVLTISGGALGEWVLRNEFLDGTAFRSSESTSKIPIVGQFHFGAALRLGNFAASARFIARSRVYQGQPDSHHYGSLTASYYF